MRTHRVSSRAPHHHPPRARLPVQARRVEIRHLRESNNGHGPEDRLAARLDELTHKLLTVASTYQAEHADVQPLDPLSRPQARSRPRPAPGRHLFPFISSPRLGAPTGPQRGDVTSALELLHTGRTLAPSGRMSPS
jgi:hypothetical protein